jgi:hypothetical protein
VKKLALFFATAVLVLSTLAVPSKLGATMDESPPPLCGGKVCPPPTVL